MIGIQDGLCTSRGTIIEGISDGVFYADQTDLSKTSGNQRLKSQLETPAELVSNA